ncbi:hypothetical protein ETAA8_66690 [Anatilimnocola aggregata]|uniref:Uncharacterized protein n=1 Tax=Anatilimnocola aggregata TaxID=2528021 RepID=A0A517YMQ8_9BACT|nr:hypothetical protein [Anatilimnocola aggregata]QDU31510.1 hypothetical protein ETAA8_66690 [Anatilimnocola aggregata]
MNYLAHGRLFIHDPYYLAGTAAPDWLSVIDRRMRLRSKTVVHHIDSADPIRSSFARGVMQHHADDDWFHQQRAFVELSLQFTLQIRDLLEPDDGFRPSFVGHILVELLIDSCLDEDDPQLLPSYYAAIQQIDCELVSLHINSLATKQSDLLTKFLPRFQAEHFLADYKHDDRLLHRLNQVMRRATLPALPDSFLSLLPSARRQVRERLPDLLPPS